MKYEKLSISYLYLLSVSKGGNKSTLLSTIYYY
jgi:hypothetical protein